MQIEIQVNNLNHDDSIHKRVLDRLVYELSNYDAHILSIIVSLSEVNTYTGTDFKLCNLRVNSNPFKGFVVEEKASGFDIAIDQASEKARRIMLGKINQYRFYTRHHYSYSLSIA
jgi:ribosome-associated translation inhibitor RaiA